MFTWPAVFTVQLSKTWRQAGLSRGFVDYSENGEQKEHRHTGVIKEFNPDKKSLPPLLCDCEVTINKQTFLYIESLKLPKLPRITKVYHNLPIWPPHTNQILLEHTVGTHWERKGDNCHSSRRWRSLTVCTRLMLSLISPTH